MDSNHWLKIEVPHGKIAHFRGVCGLQLKMCILSFRHKVTRLVCMTSWCVQPGPNNPWIIEWIFKPLVIREVCRDATIMEKFLEASNPQEINFTIVRPSGLTNGKVFVEAFCINPGFWGRISIHAPLPQRAYLDPAPTQTVCLTQGRGGTSPGTWIDPEFWPIFALHGCNTRSNIWEKEC